MPHISSVAEIKNIMKKYNLTFHKGLGQNFLFDSYYLEEIANAGDITKEDTVLEIGPGIGVLTTRLAQRAKKVIAVEIDKHLIQPLSEVTGDFPNVEIINQDILKTDIGELTKGESSVKVVANLPYYITTPIIMQLLETQKGIKSITVMIQKEVAQRLVAKPGTKEYGAITLSVNYFSEPTINLTVPPSAFIPPPKVYSAVITMAVREYPVKAKNEEKLFKIIKCAFGQRRKTLVNALLSTFSQYTKEQIKEILQQAGFDESIRGEKLTLNEFILLSERL